MSAQTAPPIGLTDDEAVRFDDLEKRSSTGLSDKEVAEYESLKPRARGTAVAEKPPSLSQLKRTPLMRAGGSGEVQFQTDPAALAAAKENAPLPLRVAAEWSDFSKAAVDNAATQAEAGFKRAGHGLQEGHKALFEPGLRGESTGAAASNALFGTGDALVGGVQALISPGMGGAQYLMEQAAGKNPPRLSDTGDPNAGLGEQVHHAFRQIVGAPNTVFQEGAERLSKATGMSLEHADTALQGLAILAPAFIKGGGRLAGAAREVPGAIDAGLTRAMTRDVPVPEGGRPAVVGEAAPGEPRSFPGRRVGEGSSVAGPEAAQGSAALRRATEGRGTGDIQETALARPGDPLERLALREKTGETQPAAEGIAAERDLRPPRKMVEASLEGQTSRRLPFQTKAGGTETSGRPSPVQSSRELSPSSTTPPVEESKPSSVPSDVPSEEPPPPAVKPMPLPKGVEFVDEPQTPGIARRVKKKGTDIVGTPEEIAAQIRQMQEAAAKRPPVKNPLEGRQAPVENPPVSPAEPAGDVKTGEPPLAPGHVRLYRGEAIPGSGKGAPAWMKGHEAHEASKAAEGRWFVRDRSEAQHYADEAPNGGRVVYVDVPASEAASTQVSNLPGEGRTGHPARKFSARQNEEHFVSEETASRRVDLVADPVAQSPANDAQISRQAEPPLVARYRAADTPEARDLAWRGASVDERKAAVDWAVKDQTAKGAKLPGMKFTRASVDQALGAATPKVKGRKGPTLGSGFGALGDLAPEQPKPFSADPQTQAAFDTLSERMTSQPHKAPFGARVKAAATSVYDRMVRAEGPVARFEKGATGTQSETGPTAIAKEGQGSSARKQLDLETAGVLGEQPQIKTTIADALSKIPANEQRAVSTYIAAKRFVTRYDPGDLPTGITAEQAARIVAEVESDPAKAPYMEAQQAVHDYHRALLRNYAEADRWSGDRLKKIEEGNPAYAPIRREIQSSGPSLGARGTGPMRTLAVKQVMGGEQPFSDPLSTLRQDGQRMISMADKARLKHAILDMAQANKERATAFIEEIPQNTAKRYVPAYDEIVAGHKAIEGGTATPEQIAKYVDDFKNATGGDVHAVWRGGKLKVFRVTEPTLAEYLRGDTPADGPIMRAYEAFTSKVAEPITRTQRLLTTGLRPVFWARNLYKDVKTYYHLTEAGPVRATKNLLRAIPHALTGAGADLSPRISDTAWSTAYKRLASEGLLGSDQMQTTKALSKYGTRGVAESVRGYARRPWAIVGDGVGKTIDVMRALGAAGESVPRGAEMLNKAEISGVDPRGPMTSSQRTMFSNRTSEITTNFRLGGKAAKQINRWDAFFNARIQGVENVRQAWVKNPARMTARTMAYSVLPEAALWAYTMSDKKRREAYYAMPEWRRATMTNIPYTNDDGSVSFYSLPMLAELDLPARAVRMALDTIQTKDPRMAAEYAKQIAGDVSPVTGLPSIVRPVSEVVMDRDSNTGRSLTPKGSEGRESWDPASVGGPGTTDAARGISGALHGAGVNLAAAKVDKLLSGYGGPLTRDAARFFSKGGANKEAADMPIAGTIFPRESESSYVDRFYQLADSIEGRRATFLYAERNNQKDAMKFVTPPGIATAAGKIKSALGVLRDKYAKAATQEDKRKISDQMDHLARVGAEILDPWKDGGMPAKMGIAK